MPTTDIKNKYLSLEDFFMSHAELVGPLVGGRAAQYAWGLKDIDPSKEEASGACRLVQAAVEKAVGEKAADWVLMVSESHVILSLDEWVADVLDSAKAEALARDTGYGDLDLNIETQLCCGRQLEAFHSGAWAKEKLNGMFQPDSFDEEEPLLCGFKMPLPQLISKLDRDLEIAIRGGMRHPYMCSVGVGALCLRIAATDSEPEKVIPVVRRVAITDVGEVVSRMKDEVKERYKGLIDTIKEQQDNLRLLPENWPTAAIWTQMQEWSSARFTGDNGLVGSDFFDGKWSAAEMPHDVHKVAEFSATSTIDENASVQMLDLRERMTRRRDGTSSVAGNSPRI